MQEKIAIIGGGNLGLAIAEGLLGSAQVAPNQLIISRRRIELIESWAERGVTITQDNKRAASQAQIVVLAVQPAQVAGVLEDLKALWENHEPILVSVVTGVPLQELAAYGCEKLSIVRAAPNTAVAIGQSATCISYYNCSADVVRKMETFWGLLGQGFAIPEELMSAATVIEACGVAYALRYIRAISQGGIEIGFDAELAGKIAAQTVKGAAELLIQTGHHPEEEIDRVTTPKGCTIAGLNEMEHEGFSSSIIKGVLKSYQRIAHLK